MGSHTFDSASEMAAVTQKKERGQGSGSSAAASIATKSG